MCRFARIQWPCWLLDRAWNLQATPHPSDSWLSWKLWKLTCWALSLRRAA